MAPYGTCQDLNLAARQDLAPSRAATHSRTERLVLPVFGYRRGVDRENLEGGEDSQPAPHELDISSAARRPSAGCVEQRAHHLVVGLEDRKVGQKLVLRDELTDNIGFEGVAFPGCAA